MIIINSLFFQITIPNNEEFVIFSKDYFVDREGNVLEDTDRTDVFEYGDIIIQTARVRYTIERVYSAYQYVDKITRYINEHINDSVININMYELDEDWEYHWDYHHGDNFKVESVNRIDNKFNEFSDILT